MLIREVDVDMLCVSGTCKHTSHGAVLSNMIIFGQYLLGVNTWSNNYRLRKCRNLSFSLHFYDRNAAVIFFFSILKYTGKNFIISLFISSICLAEKIPSEMKVAPRYALCTQVFRDNASVISIKGNHYKTRKQRDTGGHQL